MKNRANIYTTKQRILRVMVFFTFHLSLFTCFAQQYLVQHYSVEDGLSQHTIMAIHQDRDGELWLGTWDGVNRFNGYDFQNYNDLLNADPAHLRNNRIDYIYEDSLGYIWVQNYNGFLTRIDKRYHRIYQLDEQAKDLSQFNQQFIVEPRAGDIFVLCEEGLLRILQEDGKLEPSTTLYPEIQDAHFLILGNDGQLWCDLPDGSLCTINEEGEKHIFHLSQTESDIHFHSALATTNNLWFGANNGYFFRYSQNDHTFEALRLTANVDIVEIKRYSTKLIMATDGAGFFVYDRHNGTVEQYASITDPAIHDDYFTDIYVDRQGIAWLNNGETGVFRYRFSDKNLKHLYSPREERYVWHVTPNLLTIEDKTGHLWINPLGGGLSLYDADRDALVFPIEHVTNMIHTAYIDNQGTLWLSTYDNGLERVTVKNQQFTLRDLRKTPTEAGEARSFLLLDDQQVLVGKKNSEVVNIQHTGLQQNHVVPLRNELVYAMIEDAVTGHIFYGTRTNGLYYANREGQILQHWSKQHGLSDNSVYDLEQDSLGRVYIATFGGGIDILTHYPEQKRAVIEHLTLSVSSYPADQFRKVRDLLLVGDTMLYAATTNGLLTINLLDHTCTTKVMHDTHCLAQTQDGAIWVGTFGGGLYRITPTDTTRFLSNDGLMSNIVLAMQEDGQGILWLTSETAITRFDPQQQTFQHFMPLVDEKNAYFTETKPLYLKGRRQILFGYTNGYCVFSPDHLLQSDDVPPLYLTSLELSQQVQHAGMLGSPLTESIATTKKLRLKHYQSSFSISYAAFDLRSDNQIKYAYRLVGFDNWHYVGSQRKATYTNLPAGTYLFEVKSTNSNGLWVDNTASLEIEVRPSFWKTAWAWVIYIILIIAILILLIYQLNTYNRLHQEVEVEKKMADMKLHFFTNISHELRTPLTLITGPIENILSTEKLVPNVRQQLEIVQSNANRMLRLINEILDFRKLQSKKLRLKIQLTRIADLANSTAQNFQKEAADKRITFTVTNDAPEAEAWIDREKVDTILYNLLSNAFKFTPAGKSITLNISEKPDFVLLKVIDEGVGIPLNKRNILFERFSSHDEIKNLSNRPGSGIGLNLVKELVDMHKAYIEVESEVGKGTTFTVLLRTGKDHFVGDVDFVLDDYSKLETLPAAVEPVAQSRAEVKDTVLETAMANTKKSLLVVEDNEDMRRFLSNIFSKNFNVHTAEDGIEGLSKVREVMPDLIISDLMMPNMDGLQMTQHIKQNDDLNHIPIVLLTARAAIESRLEAMNTGADDYITKPFSPEYLEARVKNILKQREVLQDSYRKQLLDLHLDEPSQKSPNEVFLAKLMDFMERNMDNNQLVVEDLVNEMSMGRTVFFNKLKSLTGLSPVEFIRDIRIKRAAQLLAQGEYNVTEITYMVGMNDSRYFSKCFKAVYDMTPTEYRKAHLG